MKIATNFVSDGSDASGSVSETDTFSGKIEGREDNVIVIIGTLSLFHRGFVCWKSCQYHRCLNIVLM